jgi:hypothetical protein
MTKPTLQEKKHWKNYEIQRADGSWTTVAEILAENDRSWKKCLADPDWVKAILRKHHKPLLEAVKVQTVNDIQALDLLQKVQLKPSMSHSETRAVYQMNVLIDRIQSKLSEIKEGKQS